MISPSEPEPQLAYAELWPRAQAYLIDCLILCASLIIIVPLTLIIVGSFSLASSRGDGNDYQTTAADTALIWTLLVTFVTIFILIWLYYAISECSSWQGTIGKRIKNLKVTTLNGQKITFMKASIRYFGRTIIPFLLILVFVLILVAFSLNVPTALPVLSTIYAFVFGWKIATNGYLVAEIITAAYSIRNQSIHDKFARTVVVNK